MNSAFCPLPPSHLSLIMMLRDQLSKDMNLSLIGLTSSESVSHQFSRSVVSDFATAWTAACQASLSFTNSQSLLKFNVYQVSDVIQPSHLLSPPSPPAFNLSQHQGLFQRVCSSPQVAKVLNRLCKSFFFLILLSESDMHMLC